MSGIDFYKFEDILEECGWAHDSCSPVGDLDTLETGWRYVLSEYPYKNPSVPFEVLRGRLLEAADDKAKVGFGVASRRYAPEIQYHTIIILD